MTLVSAVIQAAVRESNVIAPTGQSLTTPQTNEALALLETLALSAVGNELGYIMEDWNMTATVYTRPSGVPLNAAAIAAFTTRPNSRLIFNLAAPATIKIDPQPQDGQRFSVVDAKSNFATNTLTLDPNGRKIQGGVANLVLNVDDTSKDWFYRSDLADWVLLGPLVLADEMPFPQEFDDYFTILLAMRLNPRYGRQLDPQSKARFDNQQLQFINRYTQSRLRSVPSPAASNPARSPEGN